METFKRNNKKNQLFAQAKHMKCIICECFSLSFPSPLCSNPFCPEDPHFMPSVVLIKDLSPLKIYSNNNGGVKHSFQHITALVQQLWLRFSVSKAGEEEEKSWLVSCIGLTPDWECHHYSFDSCSPLTYVLSIP